MFENIGSKIKALAKVICWVGIILSLIIGIIMLASGGDVGSGVGLVVIIVGCLGSWIGSFFTYGFGELIEKTTEIAENTKSFNSSNVGTDDKLELLEKWKAQGLIDEDEYLEQKSKL